VIDVATIGLRLRELLAEIADVAVESIPKDLDFAELDSLLNLDSLDALKFGLSVADEYDIADPETTLKHVTNLQQLADVLARSPLHAKS